MLRSQIQLQSAEISKLQMENQKLQVIVRVNKLFLLSMGTKSSRVAFLQLSVATLLNQGPFKCMHQQVIPAGFQIK